MKHFLNTREGLSGSPIILGDSNLIVGVHKASVVKKGDKDKNFLYNVARRIDQEMVDNIKTWAAEMKLSGEDIIVVDYEKIKGE
jgi:V8-like Glu-specific endopeptidase